MWTMSVVQLSWLLFVTLGLAYAVSLECSLWEARGEWGARL